MAKQSRHLLFDVSSAVESSYKVWITNYEFTYFPKAWEIAWQGKASGRSTYARERLERIRAMRALPSRHVPGLRDHSQCMRQLNWHYTAIWRTTYINYIKRFHFLIQKQTVLREHSRWFVALREVACNTWFRGRFFSPFKSVVEES